MPTIEKSQPVHVKTLMNYMITYMNSTDYTLWHALYGICEEREEKPLMFRIGEMRNL